MIRCVAIDFDGTLVLSNETKRQSFFVAVEDLPGGVAHMAQILSNPPGDRYAIFRRFAEVTSADPIELVNRYTRLCEEGILTCPERPGASTALSQLRSAGIRVHINSATPPVPLRSIVLRRYGETCFDGIHGGHGAKVENLEGILRCERLSPSSLVMVGDGIDDHEAALTVGCGFIGVEGGSLAAAMPDEEFLGNLEFLFPMVRNEKCEAK